MKQKKRPIREVRKEIWELDNERGHVIIQKVCHGRNVPQEIEDKLADLKARSDALKAEYPNWERTQRPKSR